MVLIDNMNPPKTELLLNYFLTPCGSPIKSRGVSKACIPATCSSKFIRFKRLKVIITSKLLIHSPGFEGSVQLIK